MTQQTQATTEAVQSVDTDRPAAPTFTLIDLQSMLRLIDTAARRGAFNASEFSSIGVLFDRIQSFVATQGK